MRSIKISSTKSKTTKSETTNLHLHQNISKSCFLKVLKTKLQKFEIDYLKQYLKQINYLKHDHKKALK